MNDCGLTGLRLEVWFDRGALLPIDERDRPELVRERGPGSADGSKRSPEGELTAESGLEIEGLSRVLEVGEAERSSPETVGELTCPAAIV